MQRVPLSVAIAAINYWNVMGFIIKLMKICSFSGPLIIVKTRLGCYPFCCVKKVYKQCLAFRDNLLVWPKMITLSGFYCIWFDLIVFTSFSKTRRELLEFELSTSFFLFNFIYLPSVVRFLLFVCHKNSLHEFSNIP